MLKKVTSGQWCSGHQVEVRRGGCSKPLPLQGVATCNVSLMVSERAAAGGWSVAKRWNSSMFLGNCSFAVPLKVPEGESIAAIAHFEPYLVNRKLCMEGTLSKCD